MMMSVVHCNFKRPLLILFRKVGDLTHHWAVGARSQSRNKVLLLRSSKRMWLTRNGHSFHSINHQFLRQIILIQGMQINHQTPPRFQIPANHPPLHQRGGANLLLGHPRPKAVPDSFDEVTMGVFRQTWHVVMNPHPEEGLHPDWRWATACGRCFHPDHFSIRDELALSSGHVLCAHPGCKKGWISVGILT